LAPSYYHLFPGLKKQLKCPFFVWHRGQCCQGDVAGWTTFWFFFEWLAKVRASAKKLCWKNPKFGHCILFPSWSG
jgi:hypothetical protein